MNLKYNDNNYYIDDYSSVTSLLEREDLKGLPLQFWYNVIEAMWGSVTVDILQYILLGKISDYDNSENVNSFIFNGTPLWLDKATRVGLMNMANCTNDEIELVLGDTILTIDPETLKDYLKKIEMYAERCYVVTAKHKINVNKLTTLEDIINYDYTSGYPEKVVLG